MTPPWCEDCGRIHSSFGLDVILPDDQWARLSGRSDGGGLLCAACIVARAARLPGVVRAELVLHGPEGPLPGAADRGAGR
jgi:hypothetical protein